MLSSINSRVTRSIRLFLGILLLGGALLIVVNVILRYFFLYSIVWTEEITRYGLIWLVFLGAGVAAREAGHLSIEVLPALLPKRLAGFHRATVFLVCAGLSAAVGYIGLQLTLRMQETGQIGTASGTPVYLIYAAIPVGCLLMILGFWESAIRSFQDLGRKDSADQRFES